MTAKQIRKKIEVLLKDFYGQQKKQNRFIPGKSKIRYGGGWFGAGEATAIVNTLLDGWLGAGRVGEIFEEKLAEYLGSPKALATNSGSSATLLAMAALTSRLRPEPLKPGDEVITPACTFATSVSAIVRQQLIPRFVDVDLETLNPPFEKIAAAVTQKTRAIFVVHTLGNPNDMEKIMKLAKEKQLWVIEDNCDGLGSQLNGKKTGSFGHMATESFYPAHHITTGGEGGAVIINDLDFWRVALTLRNWGRGCWCLASEKNPLGACGNRFNYTLAGSIPVDHRYYFSEMGYNLKLTEMQAAMGLVQLKRFNPMAEKRRNNFASLLKFFARFEDFFILPRTLPKADPCWFAFPVTIRDKVPFSRNEILGYLEQHGIEGRSLFAGNIVRHPAMKGVNYKISEGLTNSDKILRDTFFIGVWPGIGKAQLTYMTEVVTDYLQQF